MNIKNNEFFEIKKSNISGFGLFSKVCFEIGDVVLKWNLNNEIKKEDIKDFSKITKIGEKYYEFCFPEGFVNHSCIPNVKNIGTNEIAIKKINIGDEILTDYSCDESLGGEMICNCQSKNCKKIINL